MKITLTSKFPMWTFIGLSIITAILIGLAIAGDISPLWIFLPFGGFANASALMMWIVFLARSIEA